MLFLFIASLSFAQPVTQNWTAGPTTIISPNVPVIPSDQVIKVDANWDWNASVPFINNNHLARLVIALPPALVPQSATTYVYINGILDTNLIETRDTLSIHFHFPPNTVLPPNTNITIRVDSLEIKDDQNYINQKVTNWIDFISSPAETNYFDNTSFTSLFDTWKVEVPLGIDTTKPQVPVKPKEHFNIYPNPFASNVTVEAELEEKAKIGIDIIDAQGRIAYKHSFYLDRGNNKIIEDLSELASSLYIIRIQKNNKTILTKQIKKY